MRTLLALVAAAAMIGGALYVRGGGSEGPGLGSIGSSEPAVLLCVTELAAVCDDLAQAEDDVDVRVQEAGETYDAIVAGVPDADAWLTLAPWPQMVAESRARGGAPELPLADAPLETLGRSPLVLAVDKERAAVLEDDCAGLSWRCLGQRAGSNWTELGGQETWGRFKPGFADPMTSATGLLVLGQAAGEFLGKTTFSTRDLDGERFVTWFGLLGEGVPGHGSAGNTPFQQQLRVGAAQFDVVGTTEAEAGPALATSPRGENLTIVYPKKIVVAEVVLAPLQQGDGADRLRSLVEGAGKTALAEAGWRVEGQPAAEGVPATPALPAEANVPPAGALDALRGRWQEIAG